MPTSGRRILWLPILLLLVLVGIELFGGGLAPRLGVLGTTLHHRLYTPLFRLGHIPITIIFMVQVGTFIVALGLLSRFSMLLLERKVLVHTPLAASQQFALARVLSYLVFLLGVLIGLESLGLNLSSLLVVGGVLGLGVGLGLQPIVSNFVAGLILLVEQPVRIGDRIQVGELFGDVVAIKGRSTWIRTNQNVVIIVPNSEFIEQRVTNWTVNDRRVRIAVPVGVSRESDPEIIRSILLEVAGEHPDVLKEPSPQVVFLAFGESTLNFELRVWTELHVRTPKNLISDLYFAILAAFRKAGVEISFPQRDLHIRSISPEAAEVLRASFAKMSAGTNAGSTSADGPDPLAPE